MDNNVVEIRTFIKRPIGEVWGKYTLPEHIVNWNHASDDWHTPSAENDLRPGGVFSYRMAARDGSFEFDFSGVYDEVIINRNISYTLDDGRKVFVYFIEENDGVEVIIRFEAESSNSKEMQKAGWQAILDNFNKYVSSTWDIIKT